MTRFLSFPAYLIAFDNTSPVVFEAEGNECFAMFSTLELAELLVSQTGGIYKILEINDADLRMLVIQNESVPFVALNFVQGGTVATLIPRTEIL